LTAVRPGAAIVYDDSPEKRRILHLVIFLEADLPITYFYTAAARETPRQI
jgi:hypothetical protein